MKHKIYFIIRIAIYVLFAYLFWIGWQFGIELEQDVYLKSLKWEGEIADMKRMKSELRRKANPDALTATWYDYGLVNEDNENLEIGIPWYSTYMATAASRDYKKGTCLLVKRLGTDKQVVVKVNDYGPEENTGHALDLSSFAFKQLAPLKLGVIKVFISKVSCGK